MSATDKDRLQPERYKSVWRTEVAVRHNQLLHRLGSVCLGETGPLPKGETSPASGEGGARRCPSRGRQDDGWKERLLAWWTGSAVTAGWEALHDAKGELALLEDNDDVRAVLPRLIAWIQQVAPAVELRSRYERLLGKYIEGARIDRTVVRQAYQDAQIANTEWHASLRSFRNLLLVASAVLTTVLIGLAAWHAINPEFVSLCGSDEAGNGARSASQAIPPPAATCSRSRSSACSAGCSAWPSAWGP